MMDPKYTFFGAIHVSQLKHEASGLRSQVGDCRYPLSVCMYTRISKTSDLWVSYSWFVCMVGGVCVGCESSECHLQGSPPLYRQQVQV